MKTNQTQKLFSARDHDFDFCRSFLVISMIFGHSFINYYLPDYNRNLTAFVTIAFVFISGFSIGAVHFKYSSLAPRVNLFHALKRTFRFYLLYLACNAVVISLDQGRLAILSNTPFYAIIFNNIFGTVGPAFILDILPPIALTTLYSWFFLELKDKNIPYYILMIFVPILALLAIESIADMELATLELSLVGVSGCFIGKIAALINWNNFIRKMSRIKIIVILGLIISCYFLAVRYSFWPQGPILVWLHFPFIIVLMFFVYIISYSLNLSNFQWIRFTNSTIGKYTLFSYIFHIGVIKLSCLFVDKEFSFSQTTFLAFFLLGIMIACCYLLESAIKKYSWVSNTYSIVFRV